MDPAPSAVRPVIDPKTGQLTDVRLASGGKTRHLCGRGGDTALVAATLQAVTDGRFPVFLGFGLGHAPAAALRAGIEPVLVVDRRPDIRAATLPASGCADDRRLILVDDPDPEATAGDILDRLPPDALSRMVLIEHPGLVRLDRDHFAQVAGRLRARVAFRRQTAYAKFAAGPGRVLLVHSGYFLIEEIRAALTAMDIPLRLLPLPDRSLGQTAFIEALLTEVATFRPDFLLTVNHLGLDREGRLLDLLADLELPLASWFVDNPHLILHDFPRQTSPWCALFTWDRDTVDSLADMGFRDPVHLPLATDPTRFRPPRPGDPPPDAAWITDVSFVGSSMVRQAREPLDRLAAFPDLIRDHAELAMAFGQSGHRRVPPFLAKARPDLFALYTHLPDTRTRLDLELLVTWEATRDYRARCVAALLPFGAVVAGDPKWPEILPARPSWRHLPPLDYYRDLPRFYPHSKVSLNCTSMQMKGAVNQRIFDIPACGGFVLTDEREQAHLAFTTDEIVCYREPAEIPDLIRYYLSHPEQRHRITQKARDRILHEHSYRNRLASLLSVMRRRYA